MYIQLVYNSMCAHSRDKVEKNKSFNEIPRYHPYLYLIYTCNSNVSRLTSLTYGRGDCTICAEDSIQT